MVLMWIQALASTCVSISHMLALTVLIINELADITFTSVYHYLYKNMLFYINKYQKNKPSVLLLATVFAIH